MKKLFFVTAALFNSGFGSPCKAKNEKPFMQITSENYLGWAKFSDDGVYFSVLPQAGILKIYDLNKQSEIASLKVDPHLVDLAFSPYGRLIYLQDKKTLRVFDLEDSKLLLEQPIPEKFYGSARLTWSKDGKYLVVYPNKNIRDKSLKAYILDVSRNVIAKEFDRCCSTLEFSGDSKFLAYTERAEWGYRDVGDLNIVTVGKKWETKTIRGNFDTILPEFREGKLVVTDPTSVYVVKSDTAEVIFEQDIGGESSKITAAPQGGPLVAVQGKSRDLILNLDSLESFINTPCGNGFGPSNLGSPLFSPNGKYLAYCTKQRRNTFKLIVVNTTDLTQVWGDVVDFSDSTAEVVGGHYINAFSSNGDIYYVGAQINETQFNNNTRITLVNLASREQQSFFDNDINPRHAILNPRGELIYVSQSKRREIRKYTMKKKAAELLFSLDNAETKGEFNNTINHSKLLDVLSFSFWWAGPNGQGVSGKAVGYIDSSNGDLRLFENPVPTMDPTLGQNTDMVQEGRVFWYKANDNLVRFYDLTKKNP